MENCKNRALVQIAKNKHLPGMRNANFTVRAYIATRRALRILLCETAVKSFVHQNLIITLLEKNSRFQMQTTHYCTQTDNLAKHKGLKV